jgi:type IV pilus assembly protein PilV
MNRLRPADLRDRTNPPRPWRQGGVGLIEILVAVLVLSIGALGIALMQTRALANNNSSMSRSMAVVMSYSILEAMRADRANAEAGAYNATVVADSCPTDASTLANYQLQQWCANLGQTLGAYSTTQGTVACTGGNCTITVQYDDSRIGTGGSGATQLMNETLGLAAQKVVTQAQL